jgi:hypothetical protein
VAAVGGVATFSNLVLTAAGNYTLGASASSLTSATSTSFQISAAAADHLAFAQQPANPTAGVALSPAVTVSILDAYNNPTASTATVTLTPNGPGGFTAGSTPSVAAVNGVATFSNLVLTASGNYTLGATSSGLGGATSSSFQVSTAATHFLITAAASTTAGAPLGYTVTALDQFNNPVTTYSGTLHFTSTDPQASLPPDTKLTGGFGTLFATLKTAGNQTLTAIASDFISGTSGTITVSPAAADHLAFAQQPVIVVAGEVIRPAVTVKLLDPYNNLTSSTATVSLSASGPGGFTAGSTTSVAAVAGVATFSNLALDKSGTGYTLGASASGLSGATTSSFQVSPAATHFVLSVPASTTAGVPFSFTVTALDQFNNPVTGYSGTVHFISSDPQAVLPADTSWTGSSGTFTATLKTAGAATITATDPSGVSGVSNPVAVSPASPFKLAFGVQPSNSFVNTPYMPRMVVGVEDQFNNIVTTDSTGVVKIALGHNPSFAKLTGPTSAKVVNGLATFTHLHLSNAGVSFTLIVTDSPLKKAESRPFNVNGANHFVVTVSPTSVTAGGFVTVTVKALDAKNHVVPSYTGTVHFTSTDAHAVLPGNSKLNHGQRTFRIQLEAPGVDTLTVADVTHPGITGVVKVHVQPGAPRALKLSGGSRTTLDGSASQAGDANLAALLQLMEEWRKAGRSPSYFR